LILELKNKKMFYLTGDFLRKNAKKEDFMKNVNNSTIGSADVTRDFECQAVVQVENVVDNGQHNPIVLNIFDGDLNCDVNINRQILANLKYFNKNQNNEMNLKKGSIIIILNFNFSDTNDMFNITKCAFVGHTNDIVQDKDEIKTTLSKNMKFFTISQININLNNQNWYFRAKLLKISQCKEFVNRLNGSNGKFVRLQFGDSTGIIEMVSFNEEIVKIEQCVDGKFYQITNADVKYSKGATQAWEDTGMTTIELLTNKKTTIDEYEEKEKYFSIFEKPKEKPIVESKRKKNLNLLTLNELLLKNDGDIVTTICVINRIEELKEITPKNKSSIYLRNFYVSDQTMQDIKVAAWGKQAEEFIFNEKDILFLSRLKIQHFNGLTLSVQKDTIIQKIQDDSNVDANELIEWLKSKESLSSTLKRKLSIE
jgi:hypothetical protein